MKNYKKPKNKYLIDIRIITGLNITLDQKKIKMNCKLIGIELPNKHRETVFFADVISDKKFKDSPSHLAMAIGSDISGKPVVADLAKMPHLLVAGAYDNPESAHAQQTHDRAVGPRPFAAKSHREYRSWRLSRWR